MASHLTGNFIKSSALQSMFFGFVLKKDLFEFNEDMKWEKLNPEIADCPPMIKDFKFKNIKRS